MQSCRVCGTLFTARLPSSSEAKDYGGYYHEGNLEVPPFVHRRLERLVSRFEDGSPAQPLARRRLRRGHVDGGGRRERDGR